PDLNRREILDQINDAIRSNPEDASLLSMRAQLQTASGNWIEAIQDYQHVLALNPNDANSMNNLAWVLLEEAPDELRNRTEAERLAQKAVTLDPENSYALGTYGTVLLRRGEAREAVSYLERALARNRPHTDEATDRYLLSIALARSGSFEKAESALNQALHEGPENRYRPEAEAAVQKIHE